MKHLKRFNESKVWNYSHSELKEMLNGCEDILSNLKDDDFDTNINFFYNPWITFNFKRDQEFTYSDISEVVETLKSYLNNWGFKVDWQSPEERKNQIPTITRSRIMNPMTFEPENPVSRCSITFRF